MISYSTDDAIFALATPWARSAIAVVRASGDGCISMLSKAVVSKKDITKLSSNTAHFCRLISPSDGLIVDEIVLTVYKNGHGYTGEEAFEISCHGGLQVIKAVLNTMAELGLRQAQPGEFTLRAFLHGKLDLTRAEAVEELIDSRGRKGQTMALNRLSGSLFKRISSIKNQVLEIMSIVEVQLDYAEDEVGEDLTFPVEKLDKAIKDISSIHDSYDTGRLYSQGAKIVLAGPSNAGKSSLFNLFLKEDRSIVSAQKGTTRDFIEALCTIGSIPVRLYDTAGFHDSSDSDIELEGIRRSKSLMDSADIIIYMVDATELGELNSNVVADPRCIAV
ncbi:MAG: tRNA uridine-5-carboxymethylaminomethyl(34) synthesis GTPase MnmE, partial [Sphaerochaetaceae bacterium]|nr:tRNA uridine-5-carboxymethylaminomethyl(34) synthesis GTPase MnmE [Sphaerochaetaceae bacterium]